MYLSIYKGTYVPYRKDNFLINSQCNSGTMPRVNELPALGERKKKKGDIQKSVFLKICIFGVHPAA